MYCVTSYIYIGLVLGCINADLCKQIQILQAFFRDLQDVCILLHRSNLNISQPLKRKKQHLSLSRRCRLRAIVRPAQRGLKAAAAHRGRRGAKRAPRGAAAAPGGLLFFASHLLFFAFTLAVLAVFRCTLSFFKKVFSLSSLEKDTDGLS